MKCNHEVTIDGVSYQHHNWWTDWWRKERPRLEVLDWARKTQNRRQRAVKAVWHEETLTKEDIDSLFFTEKPRERMFGYEETVRSRRKVMGLSILELEASLNADGSIQKT